MTFKETITIVIHTNKASEAKKLRKNLMEIVKQLLSDCVIESKPKFAYEITVYCSGESEKELNS